MVEVDGAVAPTFGEAPAATAARSKNIDEVEGRRRALRAQAARAGRRRSPGPRPRPRRAFSDLVSATRVTPRTLRRRDIRRATADCEVVQPLISSAGAWIAPRVAPPPPTSVPVVPSSDFRWTSEGSACERSVSVRSQSKRELGQPGHRRHALLGERLEVGEATGARPPWPASPRLLRSRAASSALRSLIVLSSGRRPPSPRRRTRARPSTTYAPNAPPPGVEAVAAAAVFAARADRWGGG